MRRLQPRLIEGDRPWKRIFVERTRHFGPCWPPVALVTTSRTLIPRRSSRKPSWTIFITLASRQILCRPPLNCTLIHWPWSCRTYDYLTIHRGHEVCGDLAEAETDQTYDRLLLALDPRLRFVKLRILDLWRLRA